MIETQARTTPLPVADASTKLKWTAKLSWTVGQFGSALMWATISAFLIKFFTDVFGISPAAAGTLFLVARIADAVNDPLSGYIVDHLPWTRRGKFRPALLVGAVVSAFAFVALFAAPSLSLGAKLVYAYVTYLVWGILYDFVSIPMKALLPTMTQNSQDRNRLSSLGSIIGILGYILMAVITVPLVGAFATPQAGWRATSIIYAVAGTLLIAITVVGVRERVKPVAAERYRASQVFSIILRNKPLLILLGAFVFSSVSTSLVSSASVYYFEYAVGIPEMFGYTSMLTAVFMTIAAAFFPTIAKRWGKRKTYIVFGLIGFAGNIALFFVPFDNVLMIYILSVIFSIGMGPPGALNAAMVADTTDYAEWQNGVRSEGAIYSALSFGTKLTSGLAGAIQGYVLAATGYVPNVAQTPQALNGILFIKTIIVGVTLLISALFVAGYPLTEARHAQICREIKERRKAKTS